MSDFELSQILYALPLHALAKIDVGLEGDWSPTVTTVWTRSDGLIGFDDVARHHASHKPSLELYFAGSWFGIHCFSRVGDQNIFDERLARGVIAEVEAALATDD